MIRSIRLVNWRSHGDSRLEFSKGTNLLVGIMGAGKSSILEGISFALFGTFPALERRKLKLENILRLNEPTAKAILEFEWDGSSYKVERTLERTKRGTSSAAELYRDSSLLEHGPVAVTKHIENLTGVDYDLFTRAIYSEQNNIDYFLNLDPRRRKEEIDTLLGLDRFETARANVVSVINRFKSRRQGLESQFSRERLESLEKEEQGQNTKLKTTEEELVKASAAYGKIRQDAEKLQAGYEELRKKKEKSEAFFKEEIRLSAQLASLDKELKDKTVDEKALAELDTDLKKLEEERNRLRAQLKDVDSTMARLSKESGTLDAKALAASEARIHLEKAMEEQKKALDGKSHEQLESLQKELEKSLLSLESERKSLEREAAERSESLSRLRPGTSQCPLCLSQITGDGLAHIKAEHEKLISRTKARLAELPSLLTVKKKDNETLSSSIRKLSLLSERIKTLEKEAKQDSSIQERKKDTEAQLASNRKEQASLHEKQEQLAKEMEAARAKAAELKTLLAKKAEHEQISKRLVKVKESLSQLSFDEEAFEGARTSAEKARIEAERLLSTKESMQKELKLLSDMLKLVQKDITSLRKIRGELDSLAALEEQLILYRAALLETQTSLRLSLADAINTAMNEIWDIFYPYKNYAALKLGVTDKDYLFEVDDGNGWRPLETIASGGERACAALALRIAMAVVLTPKLGWLILDEPTHNLDRDAVELLSSALQTRVPEVVKQTFVITHDETFMGSEFASSYRLKRDKESNGHTIVERM